MSGGNLPRTRTIDGAAEYFKNADSETALTKSAIRRLLINGEVPCAKIGNKYLVTIEALESWLNGVSFHNEFNGAVSGIRKVNR